MFPETSPNTSQCTGPDSSFDLPIHLRPQIKIKNGIFCQYAQPLDGEIHCSAFRDTLVSNITLNLVYAKEFLPDTKKVELLIDQSLRHYAKSQKPLPLCKFFVPE